MASDIVDADTVVRAASALFTPGTRPERFDRALASGADLVILDLEDSVAPPDKDTARSHVARWLATGRPAVVRVNGWATPWLREDLDMARRHGCAVLVPKAESADTLLAIRSVIGPRAPLIALVETVAGVHGARHFLGEAGITRACFGGVDLAAELGLPADSGPTLDHARVELVLACAAVRLPAPLDGVTTALDDEAGLARDIARSRKTGFTGKLAVHPRQIAAINHGYAPTREELAWAQAVVEAAEAGGAANVGGHMVDRPVLERARSLLSRPVRTASGGNA